MGVVWRGGCGWEGWVAEGDGSEWDHTCKACCTLNTTRVSSKFTQLLNLLKTNQEIFHYFLQLENSVDSHNFC